MNDELLNEFIFDSSEHLSTAGAQLLELEKKSDSLTVINSLMGTMHTIKGTSGFLDLKHLYGLLNNAESLLQTVREREVGCSPKIIDLLLQVLDTVEAILDRLENGSNDQVEWIKTLTQALDDSEKDLEKGHSGITGKPAPLQAAGKVAPTSPAQPSAPSEDVRGRISLLILKDGQLANDREDFPLRVENMFQAGLKGLVVDLRSLASVSGAELKALMAAARKFPERTAFVLDKSSQQGLDRIFKLLNLDVFMSFFADEKQAVDFINASLS